MRKQARFGWFVDELRRLDKRVHMTKAVIVFVEWCAKRAGRAVITRLGLSEKVIKQLLTEL